jgi:hypothetical protein
MYHLRIRGKEVSERRGDEERIRNSGTEDEKSKDAPERITKRC